METDITKNRYDFSIQQMNGTPQQVELDVETYQHNGTLAVLMMRTSPFPEELEEMERMGMQDQTEGFREYYDCATVNLPASERLPLNVQFVDENNLPGIGDWLEKNGIAKPTEILARSGWCIYQAYEFNIPQEKLKEVHDRRMEMNPQQTMDVLSQDLEDTVLDLKDDLQKCMTLDDIKTVCRKMPESIRKQVSIGESLKDRNGQPLTVDMAERFRFTAPLPGKLPARTLEDARRQFQEFKDDIVGPESPKETWKNRDGSTLTRIGEIDYRTIADMCEVSNAFLVERRNKDGRLTDEYFAIDNSYGRNLQSGPGLKHLDGKLTEFTTYSADRTSDNVFRNVVCTFSPVGSLIGADPGDSNPFQEAIKLTPEYRKVVEDCRKGMCMQLDNACKKELENIHGETKNNSKGIRK